MCAPIPCAQGVYFQALINVRRYVHDARVFNSLSQQSGLWVKAACVPLQTPL